MNLDSKKSIVCLLLARGGSKGLPEKNIKPLNGKPLIYYTIKAIQEANIYDRIILSTDSEEIAKIATDYDVEVPFVRPQKFATDKSSALDAIQHALKWIKSNDKVYDYVQYIFPTSPLRTSEDLIKGFNLLIKNNADMVISVCENDHPIEWSNTLTKNSSMQSFIKKEYRNLNRQDLKKSFRINGSIYVGKWEIFYNKLDWFEKNTYAYIMPKLRSIDIDDEYDFKFAEFLMRENNNE